MFSLSKLFSEGHDKLLGDSNEYFAYDKRPDNSKCATNSESPGNTDKHAVNSEHVGKACKRAGNNACPGSTNELAVNHEDPGNTNDHAVNNEYAVNKKRPVNIRDCDVDRNDHCQAGPPSKKATLNKYSCSKASDEKAPTKKHPQEIIRWKSTAACDLSTIGEEMLCCMTAAGNKRNF